MGGACEVLLMEKVAPCTKMPLNIREVTFVSVQECLCNDPEATSKLLQELRSQFHKLKLKLDKRLY